MNRLVPLGFVGTLIIGYLAGHVTSPSAVVSAQVTGSNQGNIGPAAMQGRIGQVPQTGPTRQPGENPLYPAYRVEQGKGIFFPGDEIKEKFVTKYPLDITKSSSTHIAWDHSYRFTVMVNGPSGPGIHNDKTHIWYILSGTGRVALGGEPAGGKAPLHGPVKGASVYPLKPGDRVVVPPYTWRETLPDPGQHFVYLSVNVRTDSIPYP
jgi:mannose-6-phosphate isomerase-like protein (cupin superfamily)